MGDRGILGRFLSRFSPAEQGRQEPPDRFNERVRPIETTGRDGPDRFAQSIDVGSARTVNIIQTEAGAQRRAEGDRSTRELRIAWCKRLNRDRHIHEIRSRVHSLRATGSNMPPLLVVVPGAASGGHDEFMQRFSEQDLREILGEGRPCEALCGLIRWPCGDLSVQALHRELRIWLRGDTETAPIQKCLDTLGKSICFRLLVDADRWKEDNGQLVRAWVEDIQTWPSLPGGHVVICLLGVQLPHRDAPSYQQMREFLDSLSRQFASGGPVLVLPTLDLISAVQFDEWLAWVRNKDNELAMDLEAAKYDIFGPDLAPVTFGTAYRSLMNCVGGNPHHPNLGV